MLKCDNVTGIDIKLSKSPNPLLVADALYPSNEEEGFSYVLQYANEFINDWDNGKIENIKEAFGLNDEK